MKLNHLALSLFAAAIVATFTVDAVAVDTFQKVTPQRGELAAASITGTVLGTANTVLTTTKDTVILAIENTCAVELMLVMNGANFKRIPASSFRVFDLKTNGGIAFAATVFKVYYTGAAPASCNFELVSVPVR